MNTDGSGVINLTNHPAGDNFPSWSPDGAQMAFVSSRDGNPDVYVMNADGTKVTRLTNLPGENRVISWSPDGATIAFERLGGIYVMNADGSGVINLSNLGPDSSPALVPRRRHNSVHLRSRRQWGDICDELQRHRRHQSH